ncbi:MAG TPA: hypothetical protein VHD37_01730 [Candidatus Paceibacterota bacterium]|nr:hypothetical protein [Candidatus Paceibacterota bacterium]
MAIKPVRSRFWLAREMLTRPLVPKYATSEQLKGASAVIAVPFNCYLEGQPPDYSNGHIAVVASKYMIGYSLPFVGQREQCYILERADLSVVRFRSKNGERVQSQRLVRFQAETLQQAGMGSKVILVGMPEHLGRVAALCEYFGLQPVMPPECQEVPYDPRPGRPGAQEWCTSRERFSRYERTTGRPGTALLALLGKV